MGLKRRRIGNMRQFRRWQKGGIVLAARNLTGITGSVFGAVIIPLASGRGENLDFEKYLDAGTDLCWLLIKYGFFGLIALVMVIVLAVLSPLFVLIFFIGLIAVNFFGFKEKKNGKN